MCRCFISLITLLGVATSPTIADEAAVVEWVKSAAIPLKTAEAGKGLEDMQPIKALVGDARIVSLGESTHGTREIFQMKHRMLEFLVKEMGFTVFGIEASLPDCQGMYEYVLHGTGDPEKAVAGQGFWTWSTEEVLDMVKWMRAYNVDPANSGKPKLKFYGFDMQHEPSAVNAAMVYLQKVDEGAASEFTPRVELIFAQRPVMGQMPPENVAELTQTLDELGKRFDQHRDDYIARSSRDQFALARRYIVVAQQGLELAEEMRSRSSSIGRAAEMRLFNSIGADAKALREFLTKHHAQLAEKSDALLRALEEPQQLYAKYTDSKTTDQQRDQWHAQAESIQASLAATVTLGPWTNVDKSGLAKARSQADNVAKMLMVLREYHAKPNRDTIENVRDRCMADNVAWILEHEGPESKIMLWAHNAHVMIAHPEPGRGALTQGSYLERTFGDDHVVVGFSFNQGSFQAIGGERTGQMGLREWTVNPAKAGTIDAAFAKAGMEMFILDLRQAPEGDVKDWLASQHLMRMVGAVFDPALEDRMYYAPVELSRSFNAMIFIDKTTRAKPLAATPHSSMDPASVAMAGKPRLGVQLREPDDGTSGLIVEGVLPGQSAEAAGLRAGDRILRIGDEQVESVTQIRLLTAKYEFGDTVPITIQRDGAEQVISVKLIGQN